MLSANRFATKKSRSARAAERAEDTARSVGEATNGRETRRSRVTRTTAPGTAKVTKPGLVVQESDGLTAGGAKGAQVKLGKGSAVRDEATETVQPEKGARRRLSHANVRPRGRGQAQQETEPTSPRVCNKGFTGTAKEATGISLRPARHVPRGPHMPVVHTPALGKLAKTPEGRQVTQSRKGKPRKPRLSDGVVDQTGLQKEGTQLAPLQNRQRKTAAPHRGARRGRGSGSKRGHSGRRQSLDQRRPASELSPRSQSRAAAGSSKRV